jgi:mycofactocin system creatininase family protein
VAWATPLWPPAASDPTRYGRSMQLSEATWPEVDPAVLCIPVGSCEQHGPHLPMATDTIIAEAIAGGLAGRRPRTVVGPSLTVTASGEHAAFPGTLSIGTETTTAVLVELVRSADWAAGVVLVNGHGGNRAAVDAAVSVLAGEGRSVLPWWPRVPDGDAHAGRTETSLLLALRPDLVRLDRATAGATAPLSTIGARLRAGGVRAVSPNGVLGDPAGASAAEGAALLRALVDGLTAAVVDWLAPAGVRA